MIDPAFLLNSRSMDSAAGRECIDVAAVESEGAWEVTEASSDPDVRDSLGFL